MVNVMKGVLIECDPAMKQFLLHLDEKVSSMDVQIHLGRYENWVFIYGTISLIQN